MAYRIVPVCTVLVLAATGAHAQGPPPSTIAPPPSPLLAQPLAPGAPEIARSFSTPGPMIEVTPDIADQFRAEVSAVVGSGSSIRVVLAHSESYGRARRSLKLGDVYQDGWKIVSLTPKAVGLARSGETRLVDLTVADKASLAANTAAASQASQKTVITMGSLGLLPPPPPEVPAPADAAAGAQAAGVDPSAVAALVQALIVLGAQAQ
ncbi:MAG: hypothetical protein JWM33_2435 [Caulobacteraceae bacterium]|nr:hypothetical protein [Caulobacteraceae bacterium]